MVLLSFIVFLLCSKRKSRRGWGDDGGGLGIDPAEKLTPAREATTAPARILGLKSWTVHTGAAACRLVDGEDSTASGWAMATDDAAVSWATRRRSRRGWKLDGRSAGLGSAR